jgi:protein transport protein SEC20
MSFEALQERLAALQDTTSQVKELIDRLANLKFQPGSVPLTSGDNDGQEDNVATELSTEINQILREEEEDLELLQEEITDLRSGRPGSDGEHNKARLRDAASRLSQELKR